MDPGSPKVVTVVGVAGGIGSGKSSVARRLAGDAGVRLDADAIAREVLASPEVAERVRERFGVEAVDAEGRPRRDVIAARVFRDPEDRAALEGWVHPRVRARLRAGVEEARAEGRRPIVLDVPLLFENDAHHGLVALCDAIVFVDAPTEARERRVRETRGWEPGELERREAAQLPLEEKRALATHVLENAGDEAALERAVAALRRSLGV